MSLSAIARLHGRNPKTYIKRVKEGHPFPLDPTPLMLSRANKAAASDSGLIKYESATPCKRCGGFIRYVKGSKCICQGRL